MCPASVNINSTGTGHLRARVKVGTEGPKVLQYKQLARKQIRSWGVCAV